MIMGTIRDNLLYGDKDASERDCREDFESMPYKVSSETGLVDYDELAKNAELFKPAREKERETERQTERQRDRERDRDRDREKERQRDRETDRQRKRKSEQHRDSHS